MLLAGLNPVDEDIDTLIQLGDKQLLARNYDKAIETYEIIAKKRPGWPVVLEKLGDALMAAGRDDEAITSYRNSLSVDPSNSSLHYQKAIDLNGKHARAMNAYGRLCIKTSKVEKARELLEAARIADPNFTEPRQLLDSLRDDRIMRSAKHRSGSRNVKKVKKRSASKKKSVKSKAKH